MRVKKDHVIFTHTVEVDVDMTTLAKIFWGMNDDQQARFFVEVARIAKEDLEKRNASSYGAHMQWHYIGGHLRECDCATDEARSMIREISHAMDHDMRIGH